MATAFDHVMNSPQTASGKGRVGEPPPPPPGGEGIIVRVAVFFDGTKNNRNNTNLRLNDKKRHVVKIKGKDGGSSYGNYYSNPAIHEYMNTRQLAADGDHFVSHYVEGIGTNTFKEGATKTVEVPVKVKVGVAPNGEDLMQWNRQKVKVPLSDEENGQDDMYGNGFGAGPTGITVKVDSGIEQLRLKIKDAYNPKKQYIEQIVFDVFGFSRGAAAGRHFISRRDELSGPWPAPNDTYKTPKLVINFVGLYDSVSSYAKHYNGGGSVGLHLGGRLVLTNSANTDTLFCNDVEELGLNMGGVPKKVVHLAAADEHRQNFSLTNINSSLTAGVGLELTLPGVHSDVGGSYVEAGAGDDLNLEERVIRSETELRQLLAEGWYTDGTGFDPDGTHQPNQITRREEYHRFSYRNERVWYGKRSLTTDYQFITLKIMHDFANGYAKPGKRGAHYPMGLASFDAADFAKYKIPAALAELGAYFYERAHALDGSPKSEVVKCPTPAYTKWLRNHYLHRSAKQDGDGPIDDRIGMEAREDTIHGKLHLERLIIPDDDPDYTPPSLRPIWR